MAAIRCRRAMSSARQHRCTANHPGHDLRPSGAPRRSRARPGRMRRRREGPQWCSACGSLRAVLWCKDLSTHATITHGRGESKLGHHACLRTLGDWPSWAAIPRGASAGRILRTRERGNQRQQHARQRHTRQPAPLHRTRHIKGAAARGAQAGARRTHKAAAASGPSRIRQGGPGARAARPAAGRAWPWRRRVARRGGSGRPAAIRTRRHARAGAPGGAPAGGPGAAAGPWAKAMSRRRRVR